MSPMFSTINPKRSARKNEVDMEQEMVWQQIPVDWEAEVSVADQSPEFSSTPEANLIRSAQQGNLNAFNQLVLSYQNGIYGWVYSLVHDEDLAEDITQMTFVTAFEKMPAYRGGSYRAWLFKIARNRAYDVMRYNKRRPVVSLDDDPQDEEGRGLMSILPANEPTPEEAYLDMERASWLQAMLNGLPDAFRQVIELVDLFEMDYQEAAEVLGIPVGTVKSRVARARVKLRAQMMQYQAA
jgi:RNA polymerase sigma-70 factor, ECF subfamily